MSGEAAGRSATAPGSEVRTRDSRGHVHTWKVADDGTLTRQPRVIGFAWTTTDSEDK
ncbi:hypothetical protein SEA_EVAA_61 [Gordonia phage Evaa]|nr:hypothetical protein SEA_EVAA_61 [Gordonia phage Evaa]